MRKIAKGEPLEAFTTFVRQHRPQKWEELPPDISRQCRIHILETRRPQTDFRQTTVFLDHGTLGTHGRLSP